MEINHSLIAVIFLNGDYMSEIKISHCLNDSIHGECWLVKSNTGFRVFKKEHEAQLWFNELKSIELGFDAVASEISRILPIRSKSKESIILELNDLKRKISSASRMLENF